MGCEGLTNIFNFISMVHIKLYRNYLKPLRNCSTGWWICTNRRNRCLMNTTRLVITWHSEIKITNTNMQVNFRTRSLKTAQNRKICPWQSHTTPWDFWHFTFSSSSRPSCSAKFSWASSPSSRQSSVFRITWHAAIESLISQKEIQYWSVHHVLLLLLIIWLPSDLQICCDSPVSHFVNFTRQL